MVQNQRNRDLFDFLRIGLEKNSLVKDGHQFYSLPEYYSEKFCSVKNLEEIFTKFY